MKTELRILLAHNIDGYEAYEYTCDYIENANFKNFLKVYAAQRLKNANDIKSELYKRNIAYQKRTTIIGNMHLSLIHVRNSIIKLTDLSFLKECIREESKAMFLYEKMLQSKTLNIDLQGLLMLHYERIIAARRTFTKLVPLV